MDLRPIKGLIPKQPTTRIPFSIRTKMQNPNARNHVIHVLLRDLLDEVFNLLVHELVDLLGELLGLGAKVLGALDNLARGNLKVLLNGDLELLNGRGHLLGLVTTGSDNLGEVAAATTVPGEEVGGVGGDAGECVLSSDRDEGRLELLGGNGSDRVLGVLSGLKREVVGKETGDMGRSHGGTRDGVDSVLGSDPGGLNAQTRGEDISALSVVGEVGTAVIESRGTNSDGLGSSSGGVLAGIGVVVTGSNGEVDTRADGSVDSSIESLGLATTERHVGDRALESLALAILGLLHLIDMAGGSKLDTLDDIGHGARSVGSENLDSVDVSLLGNAVLGATDGAGAVSTVTIAILIGIAIGDGLTPLSSALEVDVVDVGTGINDVGIDTLTTVGSVQVLVEGTEVQGISVRDTGETPRSLLLGLTITLVLCDSVLGLEGEHGTDNDVSLDVLDVRVVSDLLDDGLIEMSRITLEAITNLEGVLQALEDIIGRGNSASLAELESELLGLAVDLLDPGVMLGRSRIIDVVLELDDVRVGNGLGVNRAEDGR